MNDDHVTQEEQDAQAADETLEERLAVLGEGQMAGPGDHLERALPRSDTPAQEQPDGKPAPSRSGLTLVRRVVGLAVVLFLLGSAVVFYLEAPDFAAPGSSPSIQQATPSGLPPSAGPSPAADPTPPSTPKPGASDSAGSGSEEKAIQVKRSAVSARPFETVQLQGTYRGGADTFLRVQRWEAGRWVAFPIPTKTGPSGQFTAYVELGQPGRHRLRVLDPSSGVTSRTIVLVIKR